MILAEQIVGKLTMFICQTAAKSIAGLASDKRKKACRSLTKLYYCLQALDDVTESFFTTAKDLRSTATGETYAVLHAFSNHLHEIERATNMFVDLGMELYDGLDILDPALARCCSALYVGKYDFLDEMSESVICEGFGQQRRVIIKMPRSTIELSALEKSYSATKAALRSGESHFWPDTWSPGEEPQEIIISWNDKASSENFMQRLTLHRAVMVEAKDRLRELLKSSFTIEEMLFQTDTHPYR